MNWESKKLKEICTIRPPKREASQNLNPEDMVSFVPMDCLGILSKTLTLKEEKKLQDVQGSYTYFADNDVLLAKITPCFENGKLGIARGLTNGIGFGSSEFVVLRSKGEIDPEFLFYFLSQDRFRADGARVMSGAVGHKRIPKEYVEDHEIPLPPLEEQKRIVGILDEAFEGIEKAQTNAQQNLANARELFEGYLINAFSNNEGWVNSSLSDVCSEKITDGIHQTPTYFDDGYIFLSSRNVTSRKINWDDVKFIDEEQHQAMHKRIAPRQGDILLAKNGTTGVAAIVDRDVVFDIYVSLAWLRPSEKILGRFMWHYINSPLAKEQFNKRLKGVGVPNLHLKEIREVSICYPEAIEDQEKIVEKLDQISDEVQRLEAIYEQKLKDLAELKQSLLQKAFSGELTSSNVVAFTRPVAQQQAVATTSPEFAANVLAYAHNWHASQQRDRTFGRVKAQKVLHMAESVAGVDMGRQPIKDAAGPNDFQHMLRAEDWAKNNLFFEFTPRLTGNGYDFKKLGDYNKLIGGALEAVKPYKDKLEKILALMMPMNTREAEVLATVHAAWNNLLLDNAAITDDAIIHEARENWTESKRSIPENEFRTAITTIRNNGIVPDGTARRVTGQESLPL